MGVQRGRHHATRHVARRPGGDDAPLLKKYQDEIAALRREREELLAKAVGAQPQVPLADQCRGFVCLRPQGICPRMRGSPACLPICPFVDGCLVVCLVVCLFG